MTRTAPPPVRGYDSSSDATRAPMLSPGTRAIHRSASSTRTPGIATHNGSPEAKASQRRAVKLNRARAKLNREASL